MQPKDLELVCAHLYVPISTYKIRKSDILPIFSLGILVYLTLVASTFINSIVQVIVCIFHIKSFSQTRFCMVVKLAMTTRTGSLWSKILKTMMLGTIARVALLYISYIVYYITHVY